MSSIFSALIIGIANVLGLICFLCFIPLILLAVWALAFDPTQQNSDQKSLHDTWEMDTIRSHPEDER